jgi:hypothetical protein
MFLRAQRSLSISTRARTFPRALLRKFTRSQKHAKKSELLVLKGKISTRTLKLAEKVSAHQERFSRTH